MAEKVKKSKKKGSKKDVEFTIYAPGAKKVCLAGEFNSWDTRSLPMKKDKKGVWKTKIKLVPGRHEYKFIANGVWVEDLPGAESVLNPGGTRNYVMWV